MLRMTWEKWRRLLLHVPHGAAIPIGLFWNPWIGGAWFVLILVYQGFEEVSIHDSSYLDVRGYMAGIPVGILLWPCVQFLGNHLGKYLGYV